MTRLLASKPQSKEKPETHKLSVEFYTDEGRFSFFIVLCFKLQYCVSLGLTLMPECCSFGSIKYQREPA